MQAYQQIKNLEGTFSLPTPSATVHVGTFDARSGRFTGTTSRFVPADQSPSRRPYVQPALVAVDAVQVVLTFSVINQHAAVQLTVNGVKATQSLAEIARVSGSRGDTATSYSVNVGTARNVSWTIQCGGKVHSDHLLLQRPLMIGAGALST